jgi:alkanesulfonate monooxygenase SsuD/methylene tetrahydromethanopterin reductase-like flavin-dependent oxidoreductase (luciferase family)
MKFYHFSEVPYPFLPDLDSLSSLRVDLPNSHYDPVKGADLFHQRLDEWCLCDDLGINIMLNEHHQTPTCVVPNIVVTASALARQTKNVRILELGNPIANRRDPVRIAEETAMVDVLSRGRLECGFVRGVPMEIAPSNNNPTQSQSRFWEAHDLIKKAWTTHDGPFRWEGKYFNYRAVNIWPRTYQQPHPPIWITTSTFDNAIEIGRRGYVCATFLVGSEKAKQIFDAYRKGYRESFGRDPAPDRFAYLGFSHVADTDEAAREPAKKLLWYLESAKQAPQWNAPPGYMPAEVMVQLMGAPRTSGFRKLDVDFQIGFGNFFTGNPDTVAKQIRAFHDAVGGIGNLLLMGHAGHMTHAETESHLKLFAKDVVPQVQDLSLPRTEAAE